MFLVCGTFDRERGKPSYIGSLLFTTLKCDGMNGGHISKLREIDFSTIDTLIWMPNISNEEEKIIGNIKKENKKLLLISSKNVIDRDFTPSDVVGRLLMTKSNLGIMIDHQKGEHIFKLLDPLGNLYCDTNDVYNLGIAIKERIEYIKTLHRVNSTSVGNCRNFQINERFIEVVKNYSMEFTKYVNAINPYRFFGNASTRCSYGFPAMKEGESIFVTRRNIDKQDICSEGFIEVLTEEATVKYYGKYAPSVDTPVQIKLFNHYPNIKYMIHGHVYIKDAPFTEHKIPCGYIEEFDDINALFTQDSSKIVVNLKGHGCLVAFENIEDFNTIKLIGRPFPED